MVNRSLVTERMTAYTALGYGLLAMLIAGVGLYGVMSYGVAVRKKEIGVRMALGADRTRVVSMILGQSLRWVMVGLLLGLPAAAIGGRLVDSMLFGLTPLDPRVVVLAVLVLLSIAVLASWIPARRASGADPMVAIRHE
jgi:ABC-type antimicrobial peptide transport system permease subunit